MAAAFVGLAGAVVQGYFRRGFFVAGMCRIHGFMNMFRLGRGLGLPVLHLAGSHLRGHRVAHPAAQGQQGDQDGEEQMAHR